LHEYGFRLLSALTAVGGEAGIGKLEKATGLKPDALLWTIESLSENGSIRVKRDAVSKIELTEEGRSYLKQTPEEKLVQELDDKGKLQVSAVKNKIGLIWAKKNNWIAIDKEGSITLSKEGKLLRKKKTYALRSALEEAAAGRIGKKEELDILVKRNLANVREKNIISSVQITPTGKEQLSKSSSVDEIGELTKELILGRKWETTPFRGYDVTAPAERTNPARRHPVSEYMDLIRGIWTGMGFQETSGPVIETAFWAFDALFSPQDHPTRDMQDTFFLSNPKTIDIGDVALLSRVKKMHETGWGEPWRKELAEQAILRQHTTSVSARRMHEFLDAPNANYPIKLFSIGKVFRNESIDYKHLAELHMCDGIIIGNNLSLANLIHTLKTFYSALGFDANNPKSVRFKPSYFPFVEPGLEINYFDEQKGDWLELGGAGIIRKEIVTALGGRRTVLAWGLGIDRLMFRELKIDSLVQLYANEAGWLRRRESIRRYAWQ
jgi:phenylalanyl-tRNA synthetase alpha chain